MESSTVTFRDKSDGASATQLAAFKLLTATRTNVGLRRSENQDSFGYVHTDSSSLFLVADGMGGARGGGTASALALNLILDTCLTKNNKLRYGNLRSAISQANKFIFNRSQSDSQLAGMGTTVVALGFVDELVLVAHVGDSRIYLSRAGQLRQLTRDHTLVQELVDSGAIPRHEAASHSMAHMLTRSLGPTPQIAVEIHRLPEPARVGDKFLLCSDGLYNHVSNEQISDVLAEHEAEAAADILIQLALDGGGSDNVTIQIITVYSAEDPSVLVEAPLPTENRRYVCAEIDVGAVLRPEIIADIRHQVELEQVEANIAAIEPAGDAPPIEQRELDFLVDSGKRLAYYSERGAKSDSKANNFAQRSWLQDRQDQRRFHFSAVAIGACIALFSAGVVFTLGRKLSKENPIKSVAAPLKPQLSESAKSESADSSVKDLSVKVEAEEQQNSEEAVAAAPETVVVADTLAESAKVGATVVAQSENDSVDHELEQQMLARELENAASNSEQAPQPISAEPTKIVKAELPAASKEADNSQRAFGGGIASIPSVQKYSALIEAACDISVPMNVRPQLLLVSGDSEASKPIDWEKEAELVSEIITNRRSTRDPTAVVTNSLELRTRDELFDLLGNKEIMRSKIGDIDAKLEMLVLPNVESAEAQSKALNDKSRQFAEALDAVNKDLAELRARQAKWAKVQQRSAEIEPIKLADEVAQLSDSVRARRAEYSDITEQYLKAVDAWQNNPQDAALAATMGQLGKDLKVKRAELELAVNSELKAAVSGVSEKLRYLAFYSDNLDRKRSELGRHAGLLQVYINLSKDRRVDLQKRYLKERANLIRELSEAKRVLSDAEEIKFRLDNAELLLG